MWFENLNVERCAICCFPVISYKWPRIFGEIVCFSCFKYISDVFSQNNLIVTPDIKTSDFFDALHWQYRMWWYDYKDLRKSYDSLLDEKWGRNNEKT